MSRALVLVIAALASCGRFGSDDPSDPPADAGTSSSSSSSSSSSGAIPPEAGTPTDGGASSCAAVPALAFEIRGDTLENVGSEGKGVKGSAAVFMGFPKSDPDAPSGPNAPGSGASIDFGPVIQTSGVRAIDFTDAAMLAAASGPALTITGWILPSDLTTGSGGNRLLSTFVSKPPGGFELLQVDATLRVGLNDYAENSSPPSSGNHLITKSWTFFAFTYDERSNIDTKDGVVQFYFGTETAPAKADLSAVFDVGPIAQSSNLAIGNFPKNGARSDAPDSRVPRAKLSGFRLFRRVLNVDEIRCEQTRSFVQ